MIRRPLWLLAAVAVAGTGVGLSQARQTAVGAAPPAAIVPPNALNAVSTVPTQIALTWPAVAGAEGYKVTRTTSAGEPETTVFEGTPANFALDRGMCTAGMSCLFTNSNISLKQVYSYRVSTIFPGPIYSQPGPAASARSVPFLAPTNLTHAVVPSPVKPGQLQVTVSWLPVTGADGYAVVPTTRGLTTTTVRTASVRFDPLPPRATYGLCVSSIYPLNIRDDAVKNCITLGL
jgi:hypothetical protein